jgi:Peptidase family C25/Propeptide_C25
MTRGFAKKSLYGVVFWVSLSLMVAAPAFTANLTVSVPDPGNPVVVERDGYQDVSLKTYGYINTPGEPKLPARIFAVAIPPGARVDSVTVRSAHMDVLPGHYDIQPRPVPRALNPEKDRLAATAQETYQMRHQAVYFMDDPFPDQIGAQVRTAGFRKYNLVDVRITPFQYRPQSGELIHHTGLTIDIEYTPDVFTLNPSLMTDALSRMEQRASELILNYQQAQAWYPDAVPGRGLYEYVIITTAALETAVADLADWEYIKGKTTTVVTVEWIGSNYTGVDLAQKMRNFLLEKYPSGAWGIEDVCLAAHHSDVPMRQIYDDPDTDLYFAELSLPDNQSWDANSNGQYLDSGDSCDFYAEVNVGRIPWSDYSTVQHICQKSVAFEMTDDPAFKKNILLLGSYFWSDTDNAVLMEAKVDQPWMTDWTMHRMYEKNADYYSTYPCDQELLHSNVVPEWSSGSYAFVNYAGHGSYDACHIYGIGAPAFIESADCASLNDNYPSIVFADACSNSETNYTNIGQKMLEQGAVGFVGSTRVAYGCPGWTGPADGSSQSLDYYFTTSVTSGDYTQGAALQRGLQEVYQMNGWNYDALEMCEWSLWGNPDLGMAFALSSDGTVMFDRLYYMLEDTAVVTVRDLDLDENPGEPDTITVDVLSLGCDFETLTLTETGDSTYVFEGSLSIQPGPVVPGDNILQVAHGDTLQATYVDADDGHGGTNVNKYADASIDGEAPVISGVEVIEVTDDSAIIHWTTDEPADSTVTYGEGVPDLTESNGTMSTDHMVEITELLDCTPYYFEVASRDEAGNLASDDNGGSYYLFITYERVLLIEEMFDTDPGWTISGGQWAFGQPTGGGGSYGNPDPTSGYTGDNVYGYNLYGDYANNIPEYNLTTPSFDCSDGTAVSLSFYRWLGVENNSWDHARLLISNNGGSSWNEIWANGSSSMSDSDWTLVEYDISAWADGYADVRLRWVMGNTDSSVIYCGWNIDDVTVMYATECIMETPTPFPTNTVAPPTYTPVPPTYTPVPPTETPAPPTDTPVIPTDTPVPPTNTPVPPTHTPEPTPTGSFPPTDTPVVPTDTPIPPTDTPVPPTDTPVPPTETPVPPTDTPTQEKGMELILDDAELEPGDLFHLHYYLYPGSTSHTLDVYILLDIYGECWCYPSWEHVSEGLDYMPDITVEPGPAYHADVFDFTWGDYTEQTFSGLNFYGAAFYAGTYELYGSLQIVPWSFE